MHGEAQKVSFEHLKRDAYLYVRQSTLKQVFENTESTQRRYALRQRAIALGWQHDQIIVIDSDLGQSGASATDREGFHRLVAEVGMGHAGIVMGLEVSRLARNSSDWHRLLEICALSGTLILDEDGVYDPTQFNDRLVLGLKGTMSEAELHLLRARMLGGLLSKARRGELRTILPIGFVYDASGRVILDPDRQVQQAVRVFFETFRRTGSAMATVKEFRRQGLKFPRRVLSGADKGQLLWVALEHERALRMLHHPRYAGAFVYGRTRGRKSGSGSRATSKVPREQWTALLKDAHPAYISWDEFERNQELLRDNAAIHGTDRRRSPPREGPALLQGLVLCGICGRRMTVRYQQRQGRLFPIYVCQREGVSLGEPVCQSIPGALIDQAIGMLILDTVTPKALQVTLAVQQEIEQRLDEADTLRRKQVERAQYEANLARQRYLCVDPQNRLVAGSLEADWNAKLRALTEATEEYERHREADRQLIDGARQERILALANDVPRLWRNPATPDRERKRMLRLFIEDVTLVKGSDVAVHVRFRGGVLQSLSLPKPMPTWKLRQIDPEIVAEIDRLLDELTEGQIAATLAKRGVRTYEGTIPSPRLIQYVRREYKLRTRFERLRGAGLLTRDEIARKLSVCGTTVNIWRRAGLLRGLAYNDKADYLYFPPGDDAPSKQQGTKLALRAGRAAK